MMPVEAIFALIFLYYFVCSPNLQVPILSSSCILMIFFNFETELYYHYGKEQGKYMT